LRPARDNIARTYVERKKKKGSPVPMPHAMPVILATQEAEIRRIMVRS
jgi:hypothetical protein